MQLKPLGASVIAAIAGLGAAPSVTRAQAGNALEEVIVTATRRAVSVQDTPLSVTAITSEALAVQNIETFRI